uniref:Putative secreted protein n=1 Tax=Anopheles triannulatus TaxID=58253 RepID=A0A2M4B754_9DIPT
MRMSARACVWTRVTTACVDGFVVRLAWCLRRYEFEYDACVRQGQPSHYSLAAQNLLLVFSSLIWPIALNRGADSDPVDGCDAIECC